MSNGGGYSIGWMALALVLLWLLPWSLQAAPRVGQDFLLLGGATDEVTPQRACTPDVLARHQEVLSIPAPAAGWSGKPQAVDVFGVLTGGPHQPRRPRDLRQHARCADP